MCVCVYDVKVSAFPILRAIAEAMKGIPPRNLPVNLFKETLLLSGKCFPAMLNP